MADVCEVEGAGGWRDYSGHLALSMTKIALQDVLSALDPADAVAPACVLVPPVLGG